MKKWYQTKIGRSFVILIAVATAVSFLPMMGDIGIYAAEENGDSETYYALPGEAVDGSGFVAEEDALSEEELDAQLQEQGGAAGIAENPAEVILQEEEAADEKAASGQAKSDTNSDGLSKSGLARVETGIHIMGNPEGEDSSGEDPSGEDPTGEDPTGEDLYKAIQENSRIEATVNSSGIATVSAHIDVEGIYFTDLCVDGLREYDVFGETEIKGLTIDMKDYPVGYHTVELFLGRDEIENESEDVTEDDEIDGLYIYRDHVRTNIIQKPSLKLTDFYTGCGYFTYRDNYNSYYYDSDCRVYFDYKRAGKNWSNGWGPVNSGATVKRAKLAAASKYRVHTYYAKKTYYTPPTPLNAQTNPKTETVVFKGPATKDIGFKTAYKKTPVKSIKAKKIKQWCKKYKVRRLSSKIYWRNGYAGWGWYRKVLGTKTYKYWYTKVKITVTMKKKPGVAGIQIGEKIVKGNKKTYSAKFTLAGKKKGKKIKVSVYSYMSTKYGGWSGKTLKKVKVK